MTCNLPGVVRVSLWQTAGKCFTRIVGLGECRACAHVLVLAASRPWSGICGAAESADGRQVQRPVRCECASVPDGDWLIVADGEHVVIFCRCGRSQCMGAIALQDVAAIVEAEPVRSHWANLDDALNELGFTATIPSRPRSGAAVRDDRMGELGTGDE
jgi:hypothetical protein